MGWMYHDVGWGSIGLGGMDHVFLGGITLALIWSLAWKGWALWLASRRDETPWFVVLLVLNTFGLLEIFYIFAIAKQKDGVEVIVNSETKGEGSV